MMGQMPKDTAKARLWMNDTGRLNKVIKTTKYIKVEQAIPIFFDYKTIVFDSLQRPRFLYDVYDKNKLISDQLK
jgi:murein L,D-transpeptidase YcbB/YkuD